MNKLNFIIHLYTYLNMKDTYYKKYIEKHKKIIMYLKKQLSDTICINKDDPYFKDYKTMNISSVNADILTTLYCSKTYCKDVVIKIVPLTLRNLKKLLNKYEYTTTKFTEIFFMRLTTHLVFQNITPNLSFLLGNSICLNKYPYFNKNLAKSKDNPAYNLIISPKADLDFKTYIKSNTANYDEMMNAYFQIFMGLYVLKIKYNIHHSDMHYGNVFLKNMNDKTYFRYKIHDKYYTIKAPILFYIADFGTAVIPDIVVPQEYETKSYKTFPFLDFKHILHMLYPSGTGDKFKIFHASIHGNTEKLKTILFNTKVSKKEIDNIILYSNVYKKINSFFHQKTTLYSLMTDFANEISVPTTSEDAEINTFNTDKIMYIPKNISILNSNILNKIQKFVNVQEKFPFSFVFT
jgi:hypothetical protein